MKCDRLRVHIRSLIIVVSKIKQESIIQQACFNTLCEGNSTYNRQGPQETHEERHKRTITRL